MLTVYALVFAVVGQLFISQSLVQATTCQSANWWHSFDKPGWSQCPAARPFLTGFWRNARGTGHDGIYRLEEAQCCLPAQQYHNKRVNYHIANWVHSFDRAGWSWCPTGYFLTGLERSRGHNLRNIERGRCGKPEGHPNAYQQCYTQNIVRGFDNKGWSRCTRAGFYLTGLYRSRCEHLYCIEYMKCCSMKASAGGNTCKSPVFACLNGGKCQQRGHTWQCSCPYGLSGSRCEHEAKSFCSATGDPHYKTFDGKRFDFMGKCKYVLTRSVEKKFEVVQESERCGTHVTCAKSVTVTINGMKIHVTRGGHVTVFGLAKNLPFRHNGVLIERLHRITTRITTNLGLRVEYDGVYNVFVTMYARNSGKVSGLCGNYNGKIHDDNLKPDNRPAMNNVELGDSWKVDKLCPVGPTPPHPCKNAGNVATEAKQKCSLMKQAPFNQCHGRVNHNDFINECEYDVCACKNHPLSCLCEAYASYAMTCQEAGVTVNWRHLSTYAQCSSPCAYNPCQNGGTCSKNGNTFKCTCPKGFNGHQCQNEEIARCVASGDPHYLTFDGRRYNFMGVCEYIFAKDAENTFLVKQTNEKCWAASCTSAVFVRVKGLEIKVKRQGVVTVFGFAPHLPYRHRGVTIERYGGKGIRISTDVGVKVEYDGVYNLDVSVSGRYANQMLGLCGNYNGNRNDEFRLQSGHLTNNIYTFGKDWEEDRSCPGSPPRPNPCLNAGAVALQAKKQCELMKRAPFSQCHNKVNQDSGFIQNCEYDVCACHKHPHACLCEEYSDYATQCSYVGVNIPWKTSPGFEMCSTPCAAGPCRNGGACTNHGNTYKCSCLSGYEGEHCEVHRCKNIQLLSVAKYVPDSRITSSSEWDSDHASQNGRLHFKARGKLAGSWCAKRNDANQWLQFDFGYQATIHEVVTQGRNAVNQWVTSYYVSYSDDGVKFKNYLERNVLKIFQGNRDRDTEVTNKFSPVIVARFIRVHPKTWVNHVSLRAGFRGCFDGQPCVDKPCQNGGECTPKGASFQCNCLVGYTGKKCESRVCTSGYELGMKNSEIMDYQITASSQYNGALSTRHARLNSNTAWCIVRSDRERWLQVDFELRATIVEILTQGRRDARQWVKTYTVSYSRDGRLFTRYRVAGQTKLFNANTNNNGLVRNTLSPVIVSRFVRIHLASAYGFYCMRVEFVGCLDEWPCNTEPCLNGGRCVDYHNSYLCDCKEGFLGKNCQRKEDDCRR